MQIKLKTLRRIIRESIKEQAVVPRRWDPRKGEPLDADDLEGFEEMDDLDEVDTDPSNNPGRPSDAFEYVGMRPKPTDALAHPSLGGGGSAGTASGTSQPASSGGSTEDVGEPTD